MIGELKEQLINDISKLQALLEEFGFCHINIRGNSMRFARSEDGGQNISIRLDDPYINVMDFVRGEKTDIISYIIKEKNTDFRSVMNAIKRILNLSDNWRPAAKKSIFGGVYNGIIHKTVEHQKVYEEDILDDYLKLPNDRFKRDNISFEIQKEFGICYDICTDRIIIPIRDQHGSLIGAKGRRNYDTTCEEDPKYLYLIPCQMSKTLFGYSNNYSSMYGNTVLIFESEKSVLQCASYGYDNAVALGSNNLSEYQAKLILQLNPKHVIFMLDNGLPLENTKRNINTLRSVCAMRNLRISYFDWEECLDLGDKCSPSDEGEEVLNDILKNYLKDESCLDDNEL